MLDPAFYSYIAVMSATPGPNNLMLATSGVNFGLRRSLPHAVGVSIGMLMQLTLMALTMAFIMSWITAIRLPLAVAGCIYLLWLSWQILNAGRPEKRERARPMSLGGAVLFQWLNPKALMMSVNSAILFMPVGGDLLTSALWLGLIGGVVNFPCILIWAITGDRLRRWLMHDRFRFAFNATMGALMSLTALWLLVDEWWMFMARGAT